MRLIGGLLLTSGRHLFLHVEGGLFFMPLMEVGDACLPALSRAGAGGVGAKRTPLTALAGHRRTIGKQGQNREIYGSPEIGDSRGASRRWKSDNPAVPRDQRPFL